ncbi:uncharacterized protein LOC115888688 isoform X2 [Sitophilus oryzae]|uniref:Uncharacterized protein LOC115888688 isoform X2 n=1 Tax=Sitophilus oryzae TaxID=7048 RepID=A0A6J2YNC0_SITOR|nr:uncharacterized protein LOC115888688 isoform X2 [Sitophilus oryzae]
MADTVKKSRIVSEEEQDLEEALLEEFNIRLKSCMSNDDLQKTTDPPEPDGTTYENIHSPQKFTKAEIKSTEAFLRGEIQHENYYDEPRSLLTNGTKQNGHHSMSAVETDEEIYENIPEKTELDQTYVPMVELELSHSEKHSENVEYEPMGGNLTSSNLYESVELKPEIPNAKRQTPTLNLPTTSFTDCSEQKSPDTDLKSSVKDRMLLSCDDTSTLLFTQTVTSPMLTPSEENIDFLKGFRRENTNSDSTSASNVSPPKEQEEKTSPDVSEQLDDEKVHSSENYYENTAFYKNTTPENMYENLELAGKVTASDLEPEENIYEHLEDMESDETNTKEENIYQNIEETLESENEKKDLRSCDTEDGSLEEFIRYEKEVSESFLVSKKSPEKVADVLPEEVLDIVTDSKVNEDNLKEPENTPEQCNLRFEHQKTENSESITCQTITTEEKLSSETYKELIYHQKCETNSNYYEKYNEVVTKSTKNEVISNREKDTETVPAEIVKNLKSQFQNRGVEVVGIVKKDSKAELKGAKIINQIKNKFEVGNDNGDEKKSDDSTEYSETIVESSGDGERSIKKKKVKKTRKEEKENISVNENGILEGENFYNVSVKSLCRSFGDLTKIHSDKSSKKNTSRMRTKSLTDMMCQSSNLKHVIEIENVFSKVSVKALKSSFSKFDALQKKNVFHVRSSDSTKAQEKFSNGVQLELFTNCKACGKQVFQMEQIKAERALWHKNCFRCTECSKQLTVDTYESNEGSLYCKPHFKALFAPKVVEDEAPPRPRKHELIIRENQPVELPPDVVRASDKPDLGLEELQSLNVKERFQVFENYQSQQVESSDVERGGTPVKRSPSILSKLAKFQKHGMDVGVSNEALDGIPIEESSSEEEVEDDDVPDGEDPDLVRAKKVQKEKPFHFTGMSDVKKKWEHGDHTREERREETKQEIQNIRNRLFLGKQEKMKEAYQQAIMESESSANLRKNLTETIEVCDTKSIKERFEKGEVANEKTKENRGDDEEEVYESEISKKSRSLFLELDASASKPPQLSPVTPPKLEVKKAREAYLAKSSNEDTVKSTEQIEEVEVRTADIQERFKFFETYKEPEQERKKFRITPPRDPSQVKTETPEREIYRDPDVVRSEEYIDDSKIAKESHTASKMLNKFRQMEENLSREPEQAAGPKPLKRFTPPPEPTKQESHSEEESSEYEEEEEEEVDYAGKLPEDIVEAQKAARAKQLRAKFEKWEANEIKKEQQNSVNVLEENGEEQSQIESTRVLRARFESMKQSSSTESRGQRIKPNRFVDMTVTMTETCQSCSGKVYPLEKISIHGNIYHKNCFKCMECSCVLRMDSYSYNQGLLYCTPHFKRLFITKGNYDSAFGLDQHKEKWQNNVNNMTVA